MPSSQFKIVDLNFPSFDKSPRSEVNQRSLLWAKVATSKLFKDTIWELAIALWMTELSSRLNIWTGRGAGLCNKLQLKRADSLLLSTAVGLWTQSACIRICWHSSLSVLVTLSSSLNPKSADNYTFLPSFCRKSAHEQLGPLVSRVTCVYLRNKT